MEPRLTLKGLGEYAQAVESGLSELRTNKVMERIWQRDHTVWRPDPTEIANRLDWLTIAQEMEPQVGELRNFAERLRQEGYAMALLLGMGGSSLAPEVYRKVFGVAPEYLDLAVLDTTDPDAILAWKDRVDPQQTLFLVSTKSGSTVETLSLFKFFYSWMVEAVGPEHAGEHFVAVTDPGSPLVEMAKACHFRRVFLNNPNVGGRYSALSYFGLVPAALLGVDLEKLLLRAKRAMAECGPSVDAAENPAGQLGVVMGQLALLGRDKLTLVAPPKVAPFGDWLEQLVAESTGKEGHGILPVVGESLGALSEYGDDRLFAALRLEGEPFHELELNGLCNAGHPVVWLRLRDKYDLGYQIFLWELATAVAGERLGINPFDQPDVEAAKTMARRLLAKHAGDAGAASLADLPIPDVGALREFLEQTPKRGYVALQAYVPPTEETSEALLALRLAIRKHTHRACTAGYGPRYLHSTGQLHKGDAGKGIFVQFISEPAHDLTIPDEPGKSEGTLTFGQLKVAQAFGDQQALRANGRKVFAFRTPDDVAPVLRKLASEL